MKKIIIGINVSKEKPDFCVQSSENILQELIVENTTCSIKSALKKVLKAYQIREEDILLCAEHTGQYTYPLACVCEELSVYLWLENPAQIKHSSGVVRGKNDRTDTRQFYCHAGVAPC